MSHEIRTPLNGVMGVAGALSGTALSGDQRDMVQLIESSAQVLERLLGDILDLARIEAGRFEIERQPFDLAQLLREVSALFEPEAQDKGIAFEVRVDEACRGAFVGDAARLRQILTNLLSNAVKFTAKGYVRLHAQAGPGGRMKFAVEDTGIGFDPAATLRLFERFQQADGSITRRYGGSGLGLAISKSLAEYMGGLLEAYSQPGCGAVFTLSLDLPRVDQGAGDGPAPAPQPAAPDVSPAGGLRVLLAEDHPTNRKVVELILGSAGVELVSVENGALALEAARAERFDLILMDMQKPVMDGLTAIRAIRAHERDHGGAATPIVALTANAMPEHAEASQAAGASDHVTKPVSAKVLLEAVARATARDGAIAAA
jgi:CheY-like chemotaxis protein